MQRITIVLAGLLIAVSAACGGGQKSDLTDAQHAVTRPDALPYAHADANTRADADAVRPVRTEAQA